MTYTYSWQTHYYSDHINDENCDECLRYYQLEIHPDFCDKDCERPCYLCQCNKCLEITNENP